MATRITKWTREKGGRKDFVDQTRRSHQPLPHHLNAKDTSHMRELARREEPGKGIRKGDGVEERPDREDMVVRKRIEWLRAQLHDVKFDQQESPSRVSKSEGSRKVEVGDQKEIGGKDELKRLQKEAKRRREILTRVRSYIPEPPTPITPKERGNRIHAKVLEVRKEQVKEREEQRKQRRKEEEGWSRLARHNQKEAKEERWREEVERKEKREKTKKDLDILCEERERARVEERQAVEATREELHNSHHIYNIYHNHHMQQAAKEKRIRRQELEREIELARKYRSREEEWEKARREEDLRYSEVKRAFARKVKQTTLDKMKGIRSNIIPQTISRSAPPTSTSAATGSPTKISA